MAVLAVGQVIITKLALTLAAAAGGGDSFPNTGKEFLAIRNAGSSITLTITASGAACNYGVAATTAHDQTITIPNDSVTYVIGPFATLRFNDANNRVQLAYSAVTSVTVGVFSLPPSA